MPHTDTPAPGGAGIGPYRVGRRVAQNVYCEDRPMFMAGTAEAAAAMVELLNAGHAALSSSPGSGGAARGTGIFVPGDPTPEMLATYALTGPPEFRYAKLLLAAPAPAAARGGGDQGGAIGKSDSDENITPNLSGTQVLPPECVSWCGRRICEDRGCDGKFSDRPRPEQAADAGADTARRYSIVLKWSDEDQAFVGRVPELPGCCFHGDTQADAIGEAASAIACWIEAAEEAGNQIPAAAVLSDADFAAWAPHPGAAPAGVDLDGLAELSAEGDPGEWGGHVVMSPSNRRLASAAVNFVRAFLADPARLVPSAPRAVGGDLIERLEHLAAHADENEWRNTARTVRDAIRALSARSTGSGGRGTPGRGDLSRVPETHREKVRAVLAFTDEDWLVLRACFPDEIERFRQAVTPQPLTPSEGKTETPSPDRVEVGGAL